jgi:adenosine deaminase
MILPYNKLEFLSDISLAELHMHISTSATPSLLWELAHVQGIKLPTKDFFEFERIITIKEATTYEKYLKMYDLLEFIQSSPQALSMLTEQVCGELYRENKMDLLEIRMNPLLRSQNGKIDLDHLIVFALQGMERAALKYPIKLGLILSLDRRFSYEQNAIIVRKAIKYKSRGVVGIDLGGPIVSNEFSKKFRPLYVKDLYGCAKNAGLGTTIHTGEVTQTDEMWEVLEYIKPDRIGHGISSTYDTKMMKYLSDKKIVLETCPTSNLATGVIKSIEDMKKVYRALINNNVLFTINTDGPVLQKTNLQREYALLYHNGIMSKDEILQSNKIAHEYSFIT